MSCLISFPAEILMNIVSHLGPSQHDFDNFDHQFKPDVTLYRLAQTCKSLRDICLPKLYEICNLKIDKLHRSLRLLRTLAARPDLAGSVKRVIVDATFNIADKDKFEDGIVLSAQDAALFNGIMEDKVDMTTVAPLRELKTDDEFVDDGENEVGKSLACLAVALAPNLTSLVLSSHYTSLGSFKPGSFPLLEAVSVQHADTEMGAGFCDAEGLCKAAPSVKRFIGYAITELPDDAYPSFTQFVMSYSAITNEMATRIPTAFPNLEKFTYDYGGFCISDEQSACPRVLSEALLGLKKTLTHVELGSSDRGGDVFMGFDDDEDAVMASFSQMQVLQSLRIHSMYLWPEGDEGEAEEEDDDGEGEASGATKLVNFLPKSIQNLYMDDLDSYMVKHIMALAKEAPAKFPQLSHVTFPGLEEDVQEVVRQAYDEHGIACSFKGVHIKSYECDCA